MLRHCHFDSIDCFLFTLFFLLFLFFGFLIVLVFVFVFVLFLFSQAREKAWNKFLVESVRLVCCCFFWWVFHEGKGPPKHFVIRYICLEPFYLLQMDDSQMEQNSILKLNFCFHFIQLCLKIYISTSYNYEWYL